jgi:hypothetical protein
MKRIPKKRTAEVSKASGPFRSSGNENPSPNQEIAEQNSTGEVDEKSAPEESATENVVAEEDQISIENDEKSISEPPSSEENSEIRDDEKSSNMGENSKRILNPHEFPDYLRMIENVLGFMGSRGHQVIKLFSEFELRDMLSIVNTFDIVRDLIT